MPVGQKGLDIDIDWFNRLKPFSSVASLSPRQLISTGKWHAVTLHTHAACSLFQPICQLLIQCLDPPWAMWGRPYNLA